MMRKSGWNIADMRYSMFAMDTHGMGKRLRLRIAAQDPDEAEIWAAIATQVVAHRRARQLTQTELAEMCGTTQSAIARMESGVRPPRIDTLLRIAGALDCELAIHLHPRTVPPGAARDGKDRQ